MEHNETRSKALAQLMETVSERDREIAKLKAAAQSAPAGEQPAPYGWVAAGQFFTGRESAVNAAGKTPCVEVYSRPQVLAELARSAERQAAAEELARQLRQACDELRALKSAPAGEREAATEAAYAAVVDGGWSSVKEMGVQIFQAGASWQRTQAAGVPEGWRQVPDETDAGGINPRYEGCYEGETKEQSVMRRAAYCLSESGRHYVSSRETIKISEELQLLLAAAPAQPAAQQEQHPDDAAVDQFAIAMKAKLAKSREKGRHGWQTASAAHLSNLLYHHMYKADPLDVANLAMMLHQNGQAIELPQEARHDQGEVQRLQQLLSEARDHIINARHDVEVRAAAGNEAAKLVLAGIDYWIAASTGQEVKHDA